MKKTTIISLALALILTFMWSQEKKREMKPYTFVKGLENTDFTKTSINLADLYAGCPKKDCIPALKNPKFIKKSIDYLKDKDMAVKSEKLGDYSYALASQVTFSPSSRLSRYIRVSL